MFGKQKTETKKKKEEKNPLEKVVNPKKLDKPRKIAFLYKRINGNADFGIVETDNGMFTLAGKTYHERRDCKFMLTLGKEKIPFVDVNEDGLVPEGNAEYYANIDKEIQRYLLEHETMVLKAVRHAELVRLSGEDKKKLDPKWVVIGLIVLVIGGAFLKSYLA